MNKTTKVLSLATAMFAIIGMTGMSSQAFANNHETVPDQPKPDLVKLATYNLIAHPNAVETDGKCLGNNSNNIHTVRGAGHEHIRWHQGDNNTVVDHCTDSIDGDDALVNIDLSGLEIEEVVYTVQLLGKPDGTLNFCTMVAYEHDDPENYDHCIIDTDDGQHIKRGKGNPGFTIPKQLFSEKYEDEVWSASIGQDLRLAKISVWIQPAA